MYIYIVRYPFHPFAGFIVFYYILCTVHYASIIHHANWSGDVAWRILRITTDFHRFLGSRCNIQLPPTLPTIMGSLIQMTWFQVSMIFCREQCEWMHRPKRVTIFMVEKSCFKIWKSLWIYIHLFVCKMEFVFSRKLFQISCKKKGLWKTLDISPASKISFSKTNPFRKSPQFQLGIRHADTYSQAGYPWTIGATKLGWWWPTRWFTALKGPSGVIVLFFLGGRGEDKFLEDWKTKADEGRFVW